MRVYRGLEIVFGVGNMMLRKKDGFFFLRSLRWVVVKVWGFVLVFSCIFGVIWFEGFSFFEILVFYVGSGKSNFYIIGE